VLDGDGVFGTADYVAPEQARDSHSADIRADVYALGCTLYHFLAGRPPFPDGGIPEKLLAHQTRRPTPLAQLCTLPDGLAEVVERMMAKDPADRYQTPGEVAAALEPYSRGAAVALASAERRRLSPAAAMPPEPGRVPVARPAGAPADPFASSLPELSGSSSISPFNLPPPGAAPSSYYSSRRFPAASPRTPADRLDTRAWHGAAEDTAAAPAARDRREPPAVVHRADSRMSWPWLILVALTAAGGSCLGLALWHRLAG
jgi:serine/threonine protein kinase